MFATISRICLVLGMLLLPATAHALTLTQQDRDDIARIEAYLTGLKTMKARFLQVSSENYVAQGTLFLKRPGRLRFEYDPPAEILMVADGLILSYVDKGLQQMTNVPLSSTPLAVLVDANVHFTDRMEILAIERDPGTVRIALRMREDKDAGTVRLVFSNHPLELRQWTIKDAQGVEVKIALLDTRYDVALENSLFIVSAKPFEAQGDRGR